MQKICAIVPIKHLSERVPGKNYRDFNGVPLFHIILNTLLECSYLEKIFVDTNSPIVKKSIETDFKDSKIVVFDRPKHLESGNTPTNVLFENMINTLNLDYDYYLQTHTTNPLLTIETINNCIETFFQKENEGYDSLFTVKQWQTRLYTNDDGIINAVNHNPSELLPTQDLKPLYEENSCLYIFKKNILMTKHHRIGYKPYIHIMDDIESSDIDIETDFVTTQLLHKYFSKFKTNTVIVTGINGDIGQAIAKEFKKYNWNVIGIDIVSNVDKTYLDKFVQCDISDPDKLKLVIDNLNLNKIDCIVNNAAKQICKPIWEYDVDEWDYTMNCNVRPAFLFTKFCIEHLKKSKNPCIINIGSIHASATSNNISAYSCSKAAIVGLTKNMALDLSKFNIRVNSISPGAIDTKMLRSGLMRGHVGNGTEEDQINNLSDKHILGNIGNPEDVASFVYYVTNNKFLTGANLIMDGGASIKLSTE